MIRKKSLHDGFETQNREVIQYDEEGRTTITVVGALLLWPLVRDIF